MSKWMRQYSKPGHVLQEDLKRGRVTTPGQRAMAFLAGHPKIATVGVVGFPGTSQVEVTLLRSTVVLDEFKTISEGEKAAVLAGNRIIGGSRVGVFPTMVDGTRQELLVKTRLIPLKSLVLVFSAMKTFSEIVRRLFKDGDADTLVMSDYLISGGIIAPLGPPEIWGEAELFTMARCLEMREHNGWDFQDCVEEFED